VLNAAPSRGSQAREVAVKCSVLIMANGKVYVGT